MAQRHRAREYRYSVIHFQPSMAKGTPAEPIGVLVQRGDTLYLVQRPAEQVARSEMAAGAIDALPRTLTQQAGELGGPWETLLDRLAGVNRFNVFFAPPCARQWDASIEELAFSLFASEVVRAQGVEEHSQFPARGQAIFGRMPVAAGV